MAQKRMFDKRVVDTDKFADLPNSSKALYFLAGMTADDKGFFQPRRLKAEHGFSDDDYKILLAKRYFIAFESGIMVITDWNKNNWLDSRRIQETEYTEELRLLDLINEKYELKDVAKQMLSQNRIEENRIEENRIEENRIEDIVEIYNTKCTNLPKVVKLTEKRKTNIRKFLKEFTIDDFIQICEIANQTNFLIGNNDRKWKADIDFLLRTDKSAKILEGQYESKGGIYDFKKIMKEVIEDEQNRYSEDDNISCW